MRQAQAEKVLLQAEVERTSQNVKALQIQRQNIIMAQAQCNNLKAQTALNKQLAVVEKQLVTTTNEHTAAQARLSVAVKATSFATKGLQATMSMLGGPAGILILAAGALMTWASKANEAREAAVNLKDYIKDLTEEFKKMNKEQREAALTKLNIKLSEQVKEIKEEEGRITAILTNLEHYGENGFELYTLDELNEKLSIARGNLADMKQGANELERQIQSLNGVNEELSSSSEQAATDVDGFAKVLEKLGKNKVDDKVKALSTQLEIVQMKTKGAKKAAYIYENALNELGDVGEQYKTTILGLIDKTKKWSEVSEEVRKVLQPLFDTLGKIYDENEKLNASKKSGRGTTRTYAEEVKELKDKLEVAKLEAKGLTVEAELLSITQKMGSKVTAEQTEELKKLIEASQAYKALGSLKSPIDAENDSFKQSKESLDKLHQLGELKQAEYYSKLEQLEEQHQINLAKIKSDAAVSKVDDAVAQVDPVQALQNENARKLALIQEFENQKWLTEQRAIELREEANRQFEQNRINAQWEIWRNQSDANEFLASSLEGLASSATSTISGLASGTMTATQAMQNFANVILNEAIGSLVQMGMQYVKNAIVAKTTAAQVLEAEALALAYEPAAMNASIATQGAAAAMGAEAYATAIGSMKALGIAGARKNGGPVDGSKMYRVGEGGKPEILMQGGRQYLIPGENGRVLSNRQITSGKGGSSVSLTINMPVNVGDSGGMSEQDGQQLAKNIEQAIRAQIQKEQRPGGLLNRR
ncbi:hypothetical protein [Gilliamella apis]|uniref:Uncharacterized protein n=2 Tax=Gilliamella apis TaxID=1970738 RepID=A0A242NWP6_9GAMM|nr:hypothetical protein [Gilliamella apis]OTQ35231.1 hypothetical protein B6C88_10070 [Gilliamella apis]OTQ36550.1 hypothetical protein B6C84_02260 [Gilliamella apis]OTQ39078.1 hypothetical protein B6D26_10320 [Gilliamella apis]OTQ40013.1 hypothetical protein B6C94_10830 [Gilliamella apis]OTQ45268.1 hypothetical protein B6C86_07930 [Gilliamella apis]